MTCWPRSGASVRRDSPDLSASPTSMNADLDRVETAELAPTSSTRSRADVQLDSVAPPVRLTTMTAPPGWRGQQSRHVVSHLLHSGQS